MTSTVDRFFCEDLATTDKTVARIIAEELNGYRQRLLLIASENFTSLATMQAQGSVLTNKYAEGYPQRRYYGGCERADAVEALAIERLCKLFNVKFANVQSHSGSQANQAVMLALMKPGDTFMAMNLASGGHLTHGSPVSLSGRWFNVVDYGVHRETGLIDYDQVREVALRYRPKVIICGASTYSRLIDFAAFRSIADEVSAYLWADIAHYSGLIAACVWPNPAAHVDVMTTTTHKTLRGPRGGAIMLNDPDLATKINQAVFPGLQGGPLVHVIAAKAVAFQQALQPDFRDYMLQVVNNARALAKTFATAGLKLVSGGTDCHMFLLDLTSLGINGFAAEKLLGQADIIINRNVIPFEKLPPRLASGIRLGTPSCTTRGMVEADFEEIGDIIVDLLFAQSRQAADLPEKVEEARRQTHRIAASFPVYDAIY